MDRALIKVDVRRRRALFEVLQSQHEQRKACGEIGFSFFIDENKRHIGYIIFEWESLDSLDRFLRSDELTEVIDQWPVEEVLEVIALRDMKKFFKEIDEHGRLG